LEHLSKLDDDSPDDVQPDLDNADEKCPICKPDCDKFVVDEDFEIFKKKIVKKAETIIECYKKKLIKCEKDKCILEKNTERIPRKKF